jgi:hypothetical protein
VLALCATATAAPDRGAYVSRAVAALRAMTPQARTALDRELYETARTACHADAQPPTAACLIDVARKRCGGDASCAAAADVIVANMLSVDDFIDPVTRIRLVRGSADFHAALAAELRTRYGVLAAELVLAGDAASGSAASGGAASGGAASGGNDGIAIDALCRERDRAVHACEPGDATCVRSLPWSRCVAALAWYVGSTP